MVGRGSPLVHWGLDSDALPQRALGMGGDDLSLHRIAVTLRISACSSSFTSTQVTVD